MKVLVISIFDSKVGIFSTPNFSLNRGSALRAWEATANDPSTDVGKYPADFTLFELGYFDDQSGVFEMLPAKVSLGSAIEFTRATRPSIPVSPTDLTPNGATI